MLPIFEQIPEAIKEGKPKSTTRYYIRKRFEENGELVWAAYYEGTFDGRRWVKESKFDEYTPKLYKSMAGAQRIMREIGGEQVRIWKAGN